MENEPSNAEQALPPEQVAAKAAILAECERLSQAGITFVAVHFDGSGDEGVNEDIKCYATEDYAHEEGEAPKPPTSRTCRNTLMRLSPTDMRTAVEASAT